MRGKRAAAAAQERVALLDVNVLVALFDPNHVHHDVAHDWFADQREAGWATCPLTENGLVRVLAHPAYGAGLRAAAVVETLGRFKASGFHHFWNDSLSLTDTAVFNATWLAGSRQVTDIYLLGLAARKRGCLATFDRSIPIRAVVGASADVLQMISA
jgi:toxin-antitoxin system PIN domain toxin